MPRVADARRVVAGLCVGGGILVSIASIACTAHDDCSCAPSGLAVQAPKNELVSITSSGPACENAKIICTDRVQQGNEVLPGCEQYLVLPSRAGECRLHIETKNAGVLDETRQIEDHSSDQCCGGLYPAPSSSWKVVVADGG